MSMLENRRKNKKHLKYYSAQYTNSFKLLNKYFLKSLAASSYTLNVKAYLH